MLIKQIKEIVQLKQNIKEREEQSGINNFSGFGDKQQRWIVGQKRLEQCLQKIATIDDAKQKSDEFFYSDCVKQIQYEYSFLLAKRILKQFLCQMQNNKFVEFIQNQSNQEYYLTKIYNSLNKIPSEMDFKYIEQESETRKYLLETILRYFKTLQIDYLKKLISQQKQLDFYVTQMYESILELFYEQFIIKQQSDDYLIKLQEQKKKILLNNNKDQNSLITQKLKQQLPIPNNYCLGHEKKQINVFCSLSNDEQYGKVLEEALLFDSFYCDKMSTNELYFQQKQRKKKFRISEHKYSKQDLEYFINQYKVDQIRMSKQNIGDMNKSDYSNRYYQSRKQRIKSEQNRSRIIEVTDKLNKKKITTIQQFFSNDLEIKQQENKEVIDYLAHYDDKFVPKTIQNFIFQQEIKEKQNKQQELIQKLFFKYSNKQDQDSSQTFQFLNGEQFINLFKDLSIPISTDQLCRIYEKCIEDQGFFKDKGLTISFFNDAIKLSANCINELDTQDQQERKISNNSKFKFTQKEIEQNNNPEEKLFKFYTQYLLPNQKIILELSDYQLSQCKYYKEFNETFQPLIKELFQSFLQSDSQTLNFDMIVKGFMNLKMCPSKITKATLRQYYMYILGNDDGLTLSQFHHFLNIISFLFQARKLILNKEIHNFLQYFTYIFEQKNNITSETLVIYRRIMIFYIHRDYLRLSHQNKTNDFSYERRESIQDF